MRGHQSGGKGCGLRCPRFPCVKAAADKWDSLRRGGMIRTVPQPPDRKGRGVCDGEGAGLRDVLGGGVPERDGVCRYEDADAASGPCARGDAQQGVAVADERCQERGAPVQGQAVQLFRVSGEGDKADKHGAAAREDMRPPVFGIVI